MADERGHDGQYPQIVFERRIHFGEYPVDAKDPQRLAMDLDGDRDIGDVLPTDVAPGACPVQEERLLADIRDDDRLPGFEHLPGHAFADLESSPRLLLLREAVGGLDGQFAGLRMQQGQRPALHAQDVGQDLQYFVRGDLQVE